VASKVDYKWLYSVEEDRFYTYEELKSRREDNPFPDQVNTHFIQLDPKLVDEFVNKRLHDPATYQIDYSDPYKLLPEVFLTPEIMEADPNARRYARVMEEIEKEEEEGGDYGSELEDGEGDEGN
jgi:hypothetical protein